MKDLGKEAGKESNLYPSMTNPGDKQKPSKIYPEINLPLNIFDKSDLELGEDVTLTLKGKITRVEKSKWNEGVGIEVRSGEGACNDKEEKEGTLLGDS